MSCFICPTSTCACFGFIYADCKASASLAECLNPHSKGGSSLQFRRVTDVLGFMEFVKHIPNTYCTALTREGRLQNHTVSFAFIYGHSRLSLPTSEKSVRVVKVNKKFSDKKALQLEIEITEASSGVYRGLSKPRTLEYQEIKTIIVYIYTYAMIVIFIRIFRLLVSGCVSLYTGRQCRDT